MRQNTPIERVRQTTKYSVRLMPASSMKAAATASTRGEFQCPMLASYDEKPPRLIVVHMCMKASSQLMPAQR